MGEFETAPPEEDKKTKVVFEKPEKPDEDAFQAAEKKAQKEHDDAQARYDAAKGRVTNALPNKDQDTPQGKRRAELINELKLIREKQSVGKAGRGKTLDEVKKLDEKLKALINEQKVARSKTPFKNVAEIDAKIKQMEVQMESANLSLVEQKKTLDGISALRKTKKGFTGVESTDKEIDEMKKKLATLRKDLDSPESKALSEKYNKIQAELDIIKTERDGAFQNISSLRDAATAAREAQQVKWHALKKLRDDHYVNKRAFSQYEYEARQHFREKKRAEIEAFDKEKKKARAQELLDEASEKAYLNEIKRAETLLYFLDPTHTKENTPLKTPSQFAIQAGRKVDDSGLKGMKVVKKEDEQDYFKGTGGKRGKKSRKAAATPDAGAASASAPASAKYICPLSVIADCNVIGIDPPVTFEEIEGVRAKVKAKLEFWKSDQAAQTEKNIAKAKKEVERLDKEESSATAPTEAHTNGHGHGETKATASVDEGGSVENVIALEDAAVADAAADLKEASLVDNSKLLWN